MAVAVQTGLQWIHQDSFAAGAFPENEVVPANGCEDIVNGLIADDESLYRRGGSVYKTTSNTTDALIGLWDGYLLGGRRTLANSGSGVWMLSADDTTPNLLANVSGIRVGRWTEIARMLMRPLAVPNQNQILIVGGTQPFTALTAGTATVAQFSTTVTGTGTAWGSVQPGSLFIPTGMRPAVIESVQSATQMTLADPYPNSGVTGSGYVIQAAYTYTIGEQGVATAAYPTCLGQIFRRLVVGNGRRVSFSRFIINNGIQYPSPLDFITQNYHQLPEGTIVTGLEALRDVLLVFTTAGVWRITGLAFDIVDALGNAQQRLEQVSRDLVLWGDAGIASWRGALVVPAIDDVHLFDGLSPTPITGGARRLYRSYVKAGHQPGRGVVHRGHYLLPILDSSNNWVDLMVWRLDLQGVPFTRWDGHGGSAKAFAVRSGDTTRQPVLLGAVGQRVEDFTAAFEPSSSGKNDADSSTHDLKVVTRTFTAGTLPHKWNRLRVRFETDDAASDNPSVTAEYATGRPGSAFTSLSGAAPEGETTYSWRLKQRARAIRFRIRTSGPSSLTRLRSVEVAFRALGRQ